MSPWRHEPQPRYVPSLYCAWGMTFGTAAASATALPSGAVGSGVRTSTGAADGTAVELSLMTGADASFRTSVDVGAGPDAVRDAGGDAGRDAGRDTARLGGVLATIVGAGERGDSRGAVPGVAAVFADSPVGPRRAPSPANRS